MKAKLFELPEAIVTQIIDLEAQAMIPVLASSGIRVTKEQISDEIHQDQEQEVIITLSGEAPVAWIRYCVLCDHLFVKSIQLNGDTNSIGALRALLREALVALEFISDIPIKSVVQTANAKSLRLHAKLGFTRIKENPKAILFLINSKALLLNLQHFVDVK